MFCSDEHCQGYEETLWVFWPLQHRGIHSSTRLGNDSGVLKEAIRSGWPLDVTFVVAITFGIMCTVMLSRLKS